jgi:hypothetical protein
LESTFFYRIIKSERGTGYTLFEIVKPAPPREKSGAIGTIEAKMIEKEALLKEREYMKEKEAAHRKEVQKVIAEYEAENE